MKLSLGTVQFGMDYGIAGGSKPVRDDVFEMLDYAINNGVVALDTASGYGEAEEVLGVYLKSACIFRDKVDITSKPHPNLLANTDKKEYYNKLKAEVSNSLDRLNLSHLDSYIFHKADLVFDNDAVDALYRVKQDKLVKKIGVSIYEPSQAIKAIKTSKIDCLQIPYNAIDRRLDNSDFFAENTNKIVYARSAFLQGLLLYELESLPPRVLFAREYIERFSAICKKHNVSNYDACLQYVKANGGIDYLVFGIDNLSQLKQMINTCNMVVNDNLMRDIKSGITSVPENVINPSMWNK